MGDFKGLAVRARGGISVEIPSKLGRACLLARDLSHSRERVEMYGGEPAPEAKNFRPGDILPQTSERLRAILFDLDGTLVDSMKIFSEIASQILHRYVGMPLEQGRCRYLQTCGIPFRLQLNMIVPSHNKINQMSEEFENIKRAATSNLTMDSDTLAALNVIKASGVGIAVSSNNYQINVLRFAESSPVQFDFALGYGEELQKGEPHLSYATSYYQCGLRELLFVGDSLSDAVVAAECGVRFIAITRTFSDEEFRALDEDVTCIASIRELPVKLGILPADPRDGRSQ
jgi:phosphoglycolate phosphatase-like HAD superfamily hydrolase